MRAGCTLKSTLDITLKMHTIKHLLRRRPLLGSDVILPWEGALIQGGAYLKNALPGGGGVFEGALIQGNTVTETTVIFIQFPSYNGRHVLLPYCHVLFSLSIIFS